MELKLVYRALRKISDWTLNGFYSEVYVEGHENVPKDGPLIIVSSHHNEIIDIATLAATIPHRRHVSFWAKSTMFANPIVRAILTSSGSIPVKRNPNRDTSTSTSATAGSSQASLFRETSIALAAGQAIGIFPEGTSYTEPGIVQIKEGAAWAAVEFMRWDAESRRDGDSGEGNGPELVVIPVGIVYTDKAKYRSRICVRYGKPITTSTYKDQFLEASGDKRDLECRAVVKELTKQVEIRLFELTINASDWETVYVSQTARDILWGDADRIPLKDFFHVSQSLAIIFTPTASSPASLPHVRAALIRYFSLLHHTGLSHSIVTSLLPTSFPPESSSPAPPPSTAGILLLRTIISLLHPAHILFLPALVTHLPAYFFASLSVSAFAVPGEDEGEAQFRAVCGGIGRAIGVGAAAWGILSALVGLRGNVGTVGGSWNSVVKAFGSMFRGEMGIAKRYLALGGAIYGSSLLIIKWHDWLVNGNLRRYARLVTILKLFLGLILPRSADFPPDVLKSYTQPPPRAINPFIKPRTADNTTQSVQQTKKLETKVEKPKAMAPWRLIRPLLSARSEAMHALGDFVYEDSVREIFASVRGGL